MKDDQATRREAAALAFDPERDDAPMVVALGRGIVADNILRTAEQAGVPILPDKSLAHVLNQLSVGDAIPQELYSVVAQVLLFVGRLDSEYGEKIRRGAQRQAEITHPQKEEP